MILSLSRLSIHNRQALFVASGATTLLTTGILFRDLADISQWVLDVDRNTVFQTFHNRHAIASVSLTSMAVNTASTFHLGTAAVPRSAWVAVNGVSLFLLYSGYINPELMMRPRNRNPLYVPAQDVLNFLKREETVIVTQVGDDEPRAFPDSQILRPHVAKVGTAKESGNPVIMTYCGLTNLGIAYETPNRADGSAVELEPLTQLENNLVLVDKTTDHVGQQINGLSETAMIQKLGPDGSYRDTSRRPENVQELDLEESHVGKEVPSWRMTLGNFVRTYPKGEVFVNDYRMQKDWIGNPIKAVYDSLMDLIFDVSVYYQATNPAPVFPTLKEDRDSRLPPKEQVWAFDGGDGKDYVAVTEQFVRDAPNGVRNMMVGSVPVVAAWDADTASLGIWRRPSSKPVENPVNIHGQVQIADSSSTWDAQQPPLERLANVKNGAFWCVWSNFYPHTRVNPEQ